MKTPLEYSIVPIAPSNSTSESGSTRRASGAERVIGGTGSAGSSNERRYGRRDALLQPAHVLGDATEARAHVVARAGVRVGDRQRPAVRRSGQLPGEHDLPPGIGKLGEQLGL